MSREGEVPFRLQEDSGYVPLSQGHTSEPVPEYVPDLGRASPSYSLVGSAGSWELLSSMSGSSGHVPGKVGSVAPPQSHTEIVQTYRLGLCCCLLSRGPDPEGGVSYIPEGGVFAFPQAVAAQRGLCLSGRMAAAVHCGARSSSGLPAAVFPRLPPVLPWQIEAPPPGWVLRGHLLLALELRAGEPSLGLGPHSSPG